MERTKRIDAEFFNPHSLHAVKTLERIHSVQLASTVGVSDGNHFSISDEFIDDGIPYFRGQDVSGSFFMEQACPVTIPADVFEQKHMRRSHLAKGDVLLSIVGTIGESALFSSSQPATCSCKLAIPRPQNIPSEFLAVFLKSEHGRLQVARQTRGAIQGSLLLEDMDQILVPRFSKNFESGIVKVARSAQGTLDKSKSCQAQAEQTLLRALGLEGREPPAPLTYTRRASEVMERGRYDAEHYQEQYYSLDAKLREYPGGVTTLGDLCPNPINGVEIREYAEDGVPYLRVGDIQNYTVKPTGVKYVSPAAAAEEIEKVRLQVGDVLVSRSGSLAVTGVVEPEWVHSVISSHLILVRIEDPAFRPHFVAAFLAAMPGKMQIIQNSNGGVQPEINQPSLKRVLIPRLSMKSQGEIIANIRQAHLARQQAQALLAKAKRAVEVAIEEGEEKAMKLPSST